MTTDKAVRFVLEVRPILQKSHDFVGKPSEGLSSVRDGKDWYHVDSQNVPAYNQRYLFVGDFSGGVAKVRDALGYFYIYPDGREVFSERFNHYDVEGLKRALEGVTKE
ncbi:MAG: hypothetical protein WC711_03665 [Candidatus Staskawiczbacteria bacterium]|jgi:hypothetical protein